MSNIKVGDKVRIQPQAAANAGVLPGDFTRGWTVLEVHQPLEAARGIRVATAKVQRRQGDGYKWFQLEHLTHDVDLPYDPKPPHKTLAEKELEVLQKDSVRRRWMELLGPQPNTEDFVSEFILPRKEHNTEVRKLIKAAQNNPYLPPGEYEVKLDFLPFQTSDSADAAALALEYAKKVGITTVKNNTSPFQRQPRKKRIEVGDEVHTPYGEIGTVVQCLEDVNGAPACAVEFKDQPGAVLFRTDTLRRALRFVPAENYHFQTAELEKKVKESLSEDAGEELWGFRVGSRVSIRGQEGTITRLSKADPGPGLYICVDMQDGSTRCGEASGVLWDATFAPKPKPARVDMVFRGISRGDTVLCPYAGNGQKRGVVRELSHVEGDHYSQFCSVDFDDGSSKSGPPQSVLCSTIRVRKDGEFKVGDHVWDRMYSTTPSRKGTVEKVFEGFSSFLVRWADGGASVRQPGTLGHAAAESL